MPQPELADIEDLIAKQGVGTLRGADLRARLRDVDPDGRALAELFAAWDDLPVDEHLVDGGKWRERRYARVLATPDGDGHRLTRLPDAPFQQAADVIPLYQGKARRFAPAEERTISNPALQALLQHDMALVRRVEGAAKEAVIGLHFVRVLADGSSDVAPAPEGRHTDGHAYICMHLVRRHNCTGGVSSVYRPGEAEPFVTHTMLEPLDTVVVDDRRVEHEVSPIAAADGTRGWRDILLVDIDYRGEQG